MIRKTLLLVLILLFPAFSLAIEAGKQAPTFTLTSFDGKEVKLSDFSGKTVVLEWFNKGCPFVQKHYKDGHMQKLQEKYTAKGVVWLTINSTHKGHQDYLTPDQTKETVNEWRMKMTHLLLDTDGKVGKAYAAKTTPHLYVINSTGQVVYQGAIDDNDDVFASPDSATNYVDNVLDKVLNGEKVTIAETKPYGCSVKYAS